ncbi:hypothetical protein EPUS_09250 [Endocarpon pusillum Z07020]|uniref:NACHT domain-containing protein n=1 Tax=Endocarpon pusillum (strain Z07020 / HMAS-L-300199) TaxID=1263415 RepID=U1HWK6_ENDPU|nr:uncharacterized protein EPUS_09250 [Endocarpon pusillum Z07020]ERF73784.1 hypothetical protein EPUS_09250 [Endocarpon pusillum Z07020]
MTLANVSQAIFSAKWTIVFYLVLAGGTIVTCLWLLRTLAHADASRQRRPECSSRQTRRAQDPTLSSRRGPGLCQVYPTEDDPKGDGPGPDIDIIAIHGLDTNSEKTWTWRGDGCKVNWLADRDMLPSRVKRVRIFTYDWPADLLQPSDLVQKNQGEFAILLFEEIRRIQITGDPARSEDRPILFIASCLGGILLMKALVDAGQAYQSVRRATRGIVFLATPFRGTSFQDVAALAEPGLNAWAWIRGREVIKLLTAVKEPTLDLVQLVQDFTSLCKDKDYPCHVFTFYEKGKTSLPSKVFPWLPAWLRQAKLLVNESSATLDMFPQPLPLSRPHILMNKFAHSECTECKKGCTESEDFGRVSGKIVEMLQKIREGSPVQQADAWIRANHYSEDRLKIERLSSDLLSLDQCYINLAIVEEPRKNAQHAEEGSGEDVSPHVSPFSLTARLSVETPEKNVQVELPSLFDPRKDSNGQTAESRRILIRGRAGVGKTTLCKKMVHEFARRSKDFRKWDELFDRVLWVPLRRLKEWQATQYDFEELFSREFFAQQDRETRDILAKELRGALKSGRTLFILDGLDEIAQELACEGYKSEFLKDLLHQPNVVITSRPHVSLPANVSPPDLELETIGFYPDQVKAYLQTTFTTDLKRVQDIQSYLQAHQLIQGLVRIPIQLDALCYIWDNLKGKAVPQTMTAMYKAIEESLWKKDILRLGKEKKHGELVTKDDIKNEKMNRIETLVCNEVVLLESLAFTGLCNDVINFEPKHQEAILEEFKSTDEWIPWDTTLPRLSFLRTSESWSEEHSRDYHFLHLTFQEYFAARYFVRQWKAKQPLKWLRLSEGECDPIETAIFLREHKYDPRYDIFWRFVAGLLDPDREALGFFQAIEEEPRDVLGPTHQRLVMHCLSEVERKKTTFMELRTKLEKQLEQWLLFECDSTQDCWLAREMECPEQVLVNALKQASEDARPILLGCLDSRASVPPSIISVAVSWLEDCTSKNLCIAILRILRHHHKALRDTMLQDTMLQGIAARLEDKDGGIQRAAIEALQGQADLTEEVLQGIAARLKDENGYIREAAIKALQGRGNLTEEMLQGIAARLKDENGYVRQAAIAALQGQADLTEEVLQGIAARLEDEDWQVRWAAIKALEGRANLTEEVLQGIAARLKDKDIDVRREAIEALVNPASLLLEAFRPCVKPLYEALLQISFQEHTNFLKLHA